jgi:hypothetical protein
MHFYLLKMEGILPFAIRIAQRDAGHNTASNLDPACKIHELRVAVVLFQLASP